MTRHSVAILVVAVLVGSVAGAAVALSALGPVAPGADVGTDQSPGTQPTDAGGADGSPGPASTGAKVATFANESAFRAYVREGSLLADARDGRPRQARVTDDAVEMEAAPEPETTAVATAAPAAGDGSNGGDASAPSRIANTNVQISGLDEPDVVKTDGRRFYYAPRGRPGIPESRPVETDVRRGDTPPERHRHAHVIDASEPADPEAVAAINATGRLLQTGKTLVVFEDDRVVGYDVGEPADPTESWSTPLNGSLVTAREHGGTLYLVTETPTGPETPCPIEPLGTDNAVACEEIHRPAATIPVDATYSAFSVDAATGEVRDSTSFVGAASNSVVYVSEGSLYVTYTKPTGRAALVAEFVREEFDQAPDHLADRIAEIRSYDISAESKEREMRRAVRQWTASLPPERRRSVREAFETELATYVGAHQRELTRTGIVRVDIGGSDLSVTATGAVPGRPLNQFSMDQHDGTLRIATTIPRAGTADSENDLYVLDARTLEERGKVTGMGVTERVYSVRYVGDTAYVVTFRRIDPFHVVDLSDPSNPEEVGELKLPGFSSYLHPVDDDHVLGIGEQRGKVKAVLFDVSDPSDPTIADSHVLDRGWSAVANSHHAFLMDRKHGVFVLPAGRQSLVMDYTGGTLSVETTVRTDDPATRARYVGDYLYVFADEAVTVVDETTWERTATLPLSVSAFEGN